MPDVAPRGGDVPPQSPANPIDYKTPAVRSQRPPITSIPLTLILVTCEIFLTGMTLVIVPNLLQILKDFKTPLSSFTVTVLQLFELLGHPLPLALLWIVAIAAPFAITHLVYRNTPDDLARKRMRLVNRIVYFVCFLFTIGMVAGILLPMADVMSGGLDGPTHNGR